MLTRVERHIIVKNKDLDHLCFLSKNLYNIANFYIRRRFKKSRRFLSAYQIIKIFGKVSQKDYKLLPAQTAQQVADWADCHAARSD